MFKNVHVEIMFLPFEHPLTFLWQLQTVRANLLQQMIASTLTILVAFLIGNWLSYYSMRFRLVIEPRTYRFLSTLPFLNFRSYHLGSCQARGRVLAPTWWFLSHQHHPRIHPPLNFEREAFITVTKHNLHNMWTLATPQDLSEYQRCTFCDSQLRRPSIRQGVHQ